MNRIELYLSPYKKGDSQEKQQKVDYINILDGSYISASAPEEIDYPNADFSTLALLNYKPFTSLEEMIEVQEQEGIAALQNSGDLSISVFRQEIGLNSRGQLIALTPLVEVVESSSSFKLMDFNVTNNRWYRYIIYPANKQSPLSRVLADITTHWYGWSITELHPISDGKFKASLEDVWVFDANVKTGEQTQNIARSEQQTLGQFPRYAQGETNYMSGNVSCLLGEMLPMSYITEYGQIRRKGGYVETPHTESAISSNERVAMLRQWKELVYSGNPKLLKDRKGESYLVTLTASSNQVQDNIGIQPDRISFTWTQIGEVSNLQIINQ